MAYQSSFLMGSGEHSTARAVYVYEIEYDSPNGVSIIWWIAQAVALPVILLSELSLSIGIPLSGYGAYIALTCVLAVACVGLIRVATASH